MIKLGFVFLTFAAAVEMSPVQKVVQLMQEMMAKGKAEKHEEQVKFASFEQFCKTTAADKQSRVEDGNDEIEQLEAAVQSANSDASSLANDIAALDEDMTGWEEDVKGAIAIRDKEHATFLLTEKDYGQSIDAMARAVTALKQQSADTPQGASLLQVVQNLPRVPASAKRVLAALLQNGAQADPLDVSAPEANAYEFQSGGVVSMLEDMKGKFEEEMNTLQKDEMSSRHAFEMMHKDLTDSIAAAKRQRADKAKNKAGREEEAATASGSLSDTTAARNEDQKYLEDLKAQCTQKASDFESRQQLRSEELEALQKATEIIASGEVQGSSEKHARLLQATASFAQFLSAETAEGGKKVAAFLKSRGVALKSRRLSFLATKVEEDPFGKVRQMVRDMITRLLEEANEEAEHKGFCDKEMGTNKNTRDAKTARVEALDAQADKLAADVATLAEQLGGLADALAENDRAMAKATEERAQEKQVNTETIADAKAAQTAVASAMTVLKEFYEKAGAATALVQGPGEDAPETFDQPYRGMGDTAGGVVGMMEVINSDFARLEAETTAEETEAQKEFERFGAESTKDSAVKAADRDYKEKTKSTKESDLAETTKDRAGTQRELEAAVHYYEKLRPQCETKVESFEEKTARRKEEIESLNEALQLLAQ